MIAHLKPLGTLTLKDRKRGSAIANNAIHWSGSFFPGHLVKAFMTMLMPLLPMSASYIISESACEGYLFTVPIFLDMNIGCSKAVSIYH